MICSTCHKNTCEDNHKICPSCRERHHNYHREHRDELLKRMRERYQNRKEEYVEISRQTYWRLKHEAFILLGDKCVVCGLTDRRALQIDHIHGGGYKENQVLNPMTFLRKVIRDVKAGTSIYQLLCANHNAIKRWEKMEFPVGGKPTMDIFIRRFQ